MNNSPIIPGAENSLVASFGARLKQEREKQSVTLDDISLSTKISTRMLRALEDEHFDQLPGGIFNKGFIRAYARCLGMDEDQVIADYVAATTIAPPGRRSENDQAPILEPPSREEFREDGAAGLPWGTLALVLVILALGFAAWGYYSRESQKEATAPSSPPPAAVAENPPPPPSADSNPAPAEVAREKPPAVSPAADSQTSSTQPAAAPVASSDQSPVPAKPSGAFVVHIKAREDSWLTVSVDGEVSTQGTLAAPAEKTIRADREITVRAGNVGALDFDFNGQKLPLQGGYGEVKTLIFDAHGLRPTTPKPEPPTQQP